MPNEAFQLRVKQLIDQEVDRFYAQVPSATHLMRSEKINLAYFRRHTVETILRIRLARIADGKAIALLARTNPKVAAQWAKYAEEEMLHDRLFLKDLERLGMSAEEVYAHEPLTATKLLQGYLYYTLEHEGALGLLCKAFFIEYSTIRTQKEWNDNITRSLGGEATKGAVAHHSLDNNSDHSGGVWTALSGLIAGPEDEDRVLRHTRVFAGLLSAYFTELSALFDGREHEPAAALAPVIAVAPLAAAGYGDDPAIYMNEVTLPGRAPPASIS